MMCQIKMAYTADEGLRGLVSCNEFVLIQLRITLKVNMPLSNNTAKGFYDIAIMVMY